MSERRPDGVNDLGRLRPNSPKWDKIVQIYLEFKEDIEALYQKKRKTVSANIVEM